MLAGERQVAPTLAEIRRDHTARYRWAATLLPPGSRVADVACGVGYGSYLLAQAGHKVLAIDCDAEAIEYAKTHWAHPSIEFRQADATRLNDLPQCDAAVCFETIEHIQDPSLMLRALRCAPLLLASVPNEDGFPYRNYRFHFRHYTKRQFDDLLRKNGFVAQRWFAQEGPESEVEEYKIGRTIVSVAQRVDAEVIKLEKKEYPIEDRHDDLLPAAALDIPKHVAILGLGPSLENYVDMVKRLGGRAAFCDEVWAINALGDVIQCDRIFHMDDVRIQEIRAAALPDSNISAMVAWLKKHPGPIITSRAHPDYPGLIEFPLEQVINALGYAYFNGTAAYALAYAIFLGVEKVSLFGCDYSYANAHDAERGRACLEFWLGIAAARGIKIALPDRTSLMDACESADQKFYGYDAVKVVIRQTEDGLAKVEFEERETLPSAEEIEARYDHSKHPSPLMQSPERKQP